MSRAKSTLPSGYKKRDAHLDLPTPDSELSYIHDLSQCT